MLVKTFETTLPDPLTYIPLYAFKSLQSLVIDDLDPRALLGWDFLADSLKNLEIRNSGIEDIADLLIDQVLENAWRKTAEGRRANRKRLPGSSGTKGEIEDKPHQRLPPSKWHALRRLNLAKNFFTSLPSSPWIYFANLVSLDLSGNLLVSVPPGLSACLPY